MLTYLRYAMATVCFALSVGCLALWWRSCNYRATFAAPYFNAPRSFIAIETWVGFAVVSVQESPQPKCMYGENKLTTKQIESAKRTMRLHGPFWRNQIACKFPLWYSVLVFASAGVGVLKLGRFTLSSAITATTVVAGLMGIAVAM